MNSLETLLDGCDAMSDLKQSQKMVQQMEWEGLCLNIFSMIKYQLMFSPLNLAIHLCVLFPCNS